MAYSNARETASERHIRIVAEEIAFEERRKEEVKIMQIDKRRFEDVELITAGTAAELGLRVRERVLDGWDIFGGLHAERGVWAQYVVRWVIHPKQDRALCQSR